MILRVKHQIAYAASMLSLFLLSILFNCKPFSTLSLFHSDLVFSVLSQVVSMGAVPFGVLLLLRRKEGIRNLLTDLRYRKPIDPKSCLFASLGLMALMTPFTIALSSLNTLLLTIVGFKQSPSLGPIYGGIGDFWVVLILAAFLPAIFEEFTHRGILHLQGQQRLCGLQHRFVQEPPHAPPGSSRETPHLPQGSYHR